MAAALAKGTTVIEEHGQGARGGGSGGHAPCGWARWCGVPGRPGSRSRASTRFSPVRRHGGARPGGGRDVPRRRGHGRRATSRSPMPTPNTWRCCCARSARWASRPSFGPEGVRATSDGHLLSADVATLPYPGVATDYSPLLVAMLTVADGVGILTENLFSGRFRYVEELRRMGADIRAEGHHAVVRGVPKLSGAAGAGARHPGRRGPGAGRARGRGHDGRQAARTASGGDARTWWRRSKGSAPGCRGRELVDAFVLVFVFVFVGASSGAVAHRAGGAAGAGPFG